MLFFLSFSVSLLIGLLTVFYFSRRLTHSFKSIFFIYIPILFIYLGGVSMILSLFKSLTPSFFVMLQLSIIILIMLVDGNFFVNNILKKNRNSTQNVFLNISKIKVLNIDYFEYLLISVVFLTIFSSFLIRFFTPTSDFDDKMYRSSAPLIWINNQSMFRDNFHNQNMNIFAMGSGLIYLWPNLFQLGDQAATVLYWISFPLVTAYIYVFSGEFTKSKKIKLICVLLYISTPATMHYFTNTLVQEGWLTLILLSYGYFIMVNLKNEKNTEFILLGIILGVLLFLKINTLVFVVCLSVFLFKREFFRKYMLILLGFFISVTLSGYLLLFTQNVIIYQNPFGTKDFIDYHRSFISPRQILIYTFRIPFALFEPPVFSYELGKKINNLVNTVAERIGVTYILPDEEKYSQGMSKYSLDIPNRKFSLIGLAWFFIIFFSLIKIAKNRHSNTIVINFIFLLFSFGAYIQVITLKWMEGSFIPYRHLISTLGVITGLFAVYLERNFKSISKVIQTILIMLLLFSSTERILINKDMLDQIFMEENLTDKNRDKKFLFPFEIFLMFLDKPTSILLIGEEETPMSPLFWYKGKNVNRVFMPRHRYFSEISGTDIDNQVKSEKIEYLIIYTLNHDPIF